MGRVADGAGNQNDGRALRVEQQVLAAQKCCPLDARRGADARLLVGRDKAGLAGAHRAQIEIGRQHAGEPGFERSAERVDHDDHGDHEAEADDDRGDADRNLARGRLKLGDRQRGRREGGHGQTPQANRRKPGHEQHCAEQDQRDRAVTGDRQPVHRRRQREEEPNHDENHARPDRAQPLQSFFLVAGAQRLCRRTPRRFERGRGRTEDRERRAEREVEGQRGGVEVQAGGDRAEITGAEVGTETPHGVPGDCVAQDDAASRARSPDHGTLRDQQRGELCSRHPDHAHQRELGTPPQQRQDLR